MEKDCEYKRVGTVYYKTIYKPNFYGDTIKLLIRWDAETIRQDHGKDYLSIVPKYDGFGFYPGHINYILENSGFLNRYHPIENQPLKGNCETTLTFIKHIFEEQYELGLDYITLLYLQPIQRLPILCLVSKENNTGKSTFLHFLKAIFENNMTLNTNEDFRSNFNADWTDKLLIGVEEALLNRKEDSERIKTLSTARSFKTEAKNKDKFEEGFIGKFILCGNNEDGFIIIEPEETRFWVRKINSIEKKDHFFVDKLTKEIPHFLYYLANRELKPPKVITRMWFDPKDIATEALNRVKRKNCNRTEMELLELFREILESKELRQICFTNTNVKTLLERSGIKQNRSEVRSLIENKLGLTQQSNSLTYQEYYYDSTGGLYERSVVGRYYALKREEFNRIYDELMK